MTKPASYLAVVDCGTNTFHLLIVKKDINASLGYTVLSRIRNYVHLARAGISLIAEDALNDALQAISTFAEVLLLYPDIEVKVVGTEAMRIAANGYLISEYIHQQLGVTPMVITGDREAELIWKGTRLSIPSSERNYMIMDIGGGSTEFILVADGQLRFSKSYPLGVTKLYNEFHDSEPISSEAVHNLRDFILQETTDLQSHLSTTSCQLLVGASGTFEVLASMSSVDIADDHLVYIMPFEFEAMCGRVLPKTLEQRLSVEGIPSSRAKLISVGFVLIDTVMSMGVFDRIGISALAIKEGIINEWLLDLD